MQRYQIKVEYDGTNFVGWQYQKNGLSIQEILQRAIFQFSREKVTVTGAGRTDSGVHAIGQIAHFDLKKKINKKKVNKNTLFYIPRKKPGYDTIFFLGMIKFSKNKIKKHLKTIIK